jgi:hypothetical protein
MIKKTFNDLIREKGQKNNTIEVISPNKYKFPGWIIGQQDPWIGNINKFCLISGYSSQILYDVLILNLLSEKNRPKCPVCGKDCLFRSFSYGYKKGCCGSHGYSSKVLDDNKIEIAESSYPELPHLQGYYRKLLDDKFGGKIRPLELITSYSGKIKFFCNDKDPITGEIHGEFISSVRNLVDSPFGCPQCYSEHQSNGENIPWKFDFFQRLQKLYPNQIRFIHSNGEKFPTIHTKLNFRCLICNNEFNSTANRLIFHKPIHNKTTKLIACPKCTKSFSVDENRKWTREACLMEAKKYKSKVEYMKNNSPAYASSLKNGWLTDYTWFVTPEKLYIDPNGNEKLYSIYEYNFSNLGIKATYVGLTYNLDNRKSSHKSIRITSKGKIRKSAVLKFCELNKIDLGKVEKQIFTILEEGLTGTEAQTREDYWKKLRESDGYKILNIAKTGLGIGSLGAAGRKWSLESSIKELERAVKDDPRIKTRSDIEKYYNRPYVIVRNADSNSINGDSSRLDRIIPSKKKNSINQDKVKRK